MHQLFASARRLQPPEPSSDLEQGVLRAIAREARKPEAGVLEQIGSLFPQFAWAAIVIIGVCVATEFYELRDEATLCSEVQQLADEWLFAQQ